MATFNRKSFAQFVQDQAAAMQAACATLIDFTVGSINLALIEANAAAVGLWLQRLIYKVLLISRLATSSGTDVDTFLAQFGLTRLAATAATGLVTFFRLSVASSDTVVPVGALLKTADGTQSYLVTADPMNPAYSAAAGGYVIPAGALNVTAAVQATTPGSGGNVAAGAISVPASQMPGVDTVRNAAALVNGLDAETDAACKARFIDFIASLSKATTPALRYAITSRQQGLQVAIHENVTPDGSQLFGFVSIFVDDGSGSPYAALIAIAAAAVETARAASIRVGVFAARLFGAKVSLTVSVDPAYVQQTVVAAVESAVAGYVDALGLEQPLHLTRLYAVAYAVPGVTNVAGLTVNGAAIDLVPGLGQTIKLGPPPTVLPA